MFAKLSRVFLFLSSYSWKGVISLVLPVTWIQSLTGDYDMISLTRKAEGYFTGTYWKRNKFIEGR